ncbi:MAG: hypothetical protein K5989_05440 [Lachnospiraceae bacterium]|nr:hypothetical protein [Lachnospiraceae bacterium]
MKRKYLSVALAALLAGSMMTACGGAKTESASTAAAGASEAGADKEAAASEDKQTKEAAASEAKADKEAASDENASEAEDTLAAYGSEADEDGLGDKILEEDDMEGDEKPEVGEDGIVNSSAWLGYYQNSDGQSLTIFPDMGNRLDVTAVTYSEDGWREWNATAVISDSDTTRAAMDIGGGSEVTLILGDDGIKLDTSALGGLFMDGDYLKQEEPVDSSVNAPHDSSESTDYSVATDFSAADVETYAKNVRIEILHGDIDSLVMKANYPFNINGKEYADEEALFAALDAEDSILKDKDFLDKVREDDASNMFANYQGIMMGEAGNVWMGEVLDKDGNSQGLMILSFNK